MTFRATCITLFPEAFPGILGVSIVGTALRQGIWQLDTVDIRENDFSSFHHKRLTLGKRGLFPALKNLSRTCDRCRHFTFSRELYTPNLIARCRIERNKVVRV